jgi:hypothetical protein
VQWERSQVASKPRELKSGTDTVLAKKETPWRHIGISFEIDARPRDFQVLKMVVPQPLPMLKAMEAWNLLSQDEQHCKYLQQPKKQK